MPLTGLGLSLLAMVQGCLICVPETTKIWLSAGAVRWRNWSVPVSAF